MRYRILQGIPYIFCGNKSIVNEKDFLLLVEKRKVRCLVLVKTGSANSLTPKTRSPYSETIDDAHSLIIHDKPMMSLITALLYSNSRFSLPIVDGTNITDNIDIKLKSKLSDLKAVNEELASFGLSLVEKEWMTSMLVIRDK